MKMAMSLFLCSSKKKKNQVSEFGIEVEDIIIKIAFHYLPFV
jgi:hypothetical protein